MRKPRDLTDYVDAAAVLRFLRAQIEYFERKALANPRMVYKVRMDTSYWVEGWEKPPRRSAAEEGK